MFYCVLHSKLPIFRVKSVKHTGTACGVCDKYEVCRAVGESDIPITTAGGPLWHRNIGLRRMSGSLTLRNPFNLSFTEFCSGAFLDQILLRREGDQNFGLTHRSGAV